MWSPSICQDGKTTGAFVFTGDDIIYTNVSTGEWTICSVQTTTQVLHLI